jgi:hypothetical protein
MFRNLFSAFLCFVFLLSVSSQAQVLPPLKEYTVKRAPGPIVLDGKLNDPGWAEAPLTDKFVIYYNGNDPVYATQAKMLWDDKYLYVGFINTDKEVWAKTVVWTTGCLCSEEVVEVFIDPDGDGLNYLECEINPYKAVMDLQLNKEPSKGGTLNYNFTYQDLKIGVTFQGTLNDSTDVDTGWICELAFPFSEISTWAPTMNFPPKNGDMWRLNLYRYNYDRVNIKNPELSAWTQTETSKARGFHAPDRFSRVFFSTEISGTPTLVNRTGELPQKMAVTRNFPNPFNPSTTIEFVSPSSGFARLDIFNVTGQKIRTLLSKEIDPGIYTMTWDGRDANGESAPSGVYFSRLSMGAMSSANRMLLLK